MELDAVFQKFDADRDGTIDCNEFIKGLKGDLNANRKKFVKQAFNILDRDRSGYITLDEMLAVYNVKCNPEVQSGRKSEKQAMKEFITVWDTDGDGEVSYKEFEDYYKGVSAS